jgi:hypothetical protein
MGPSLYTCSANFSKYTTFNFSLVGSVITTVNITGQPVSTSSLVDTSTPAALSSTATETDGHCETDCDSRSSDDQL